MQLNIQYPQSTDPPSLPTKMYRSLLKFVKITKSDQSFYRNSSALSARRLGLSRCSASFRPFDRYFLASISRHSIFKFFHHPPTDSPTDSSPSREPVELCKPKKSDRFLEDFLWRSSCEELFRKSLIRISCEALFRRFSSRTLHLLEKPLD